MQPIDSNQKSQPPAGLVVFAVVNFFFAALTLTLIAFYFQNSLFARELNRQLDFTVTAYGLARLLGFSLLCVLTGVGFLRTSYRLGFLCGLLLCIAWSAEAVRAIALHGVSPFALRLAYPLLLVFMLVFRYRPYFTGEVPRVATGSPGAYNTLRIILGVVSAIAGSLILATFALLDYMGFRGGACLALFAAGIAAGLFGITLYVAEITKTNTMAVAAFLLGLLSVLWPLLEEEQLLRVLWYYRVLTHTVFGPIMALILGLLARRQMTSINNSKGWRLATASIVMGIIGLLWYISLTARWY